jgi:hypothetical protein
VTKAKGVTKKKRKVKKEEVQARKTGYLETKVELRKRGHLKIDRVR